MGKLIDIEKIHWNGGATCPEWISRAQLEEMPEADTGRLLMSDVERSRKLHEIIGKIHGTEILAKLAQAQIEKYSDEIAAICIEKEKI